MNQGVQEGKCITNKATPTRTTPFSKEKGAALGGTRTHDTQLTRQSALRTKLPGQLSRQGSKSMPSLLLSLLRMFMNAHEAVQNN